MIRFTKIRYKNILSSGNTFTEIDLSSNRMTIISGKNGAGKSTGVLESVSFALYGKPFRKITKNQLINSVNKKDLLVELEFETPDHSYLIRRGIKPNLFEIHRDGSLVNQESSVAEYQSMLENQILKINYKAFTQVVVLGSATYIPFMELPAGSRREIIEDLLDLEVFSKMNELLKQRVSENKEAVRDVEDTVRSKQYALEAANRVNDHIDQAHKNTSAEFDRKIAEVVTEYKTVTDAIKTREKELESISSEIKLLLDPTKELEERKVTGAMLVSKLKQLDTDTEFFENTECCSVCSQDIGLKHKELILEGIKVRKEAYKTELGEIVKRLETLQGIKRERDTKSLNITAIENDLRNQRMNLVTLETRGANLQKEKKASKTNSSERQDTESLEKSLEASKTEYDDLMKQREILSASGVLLKDSGVKAAFITEYIPLMNTLINQYLEAFDLFVEFTLDENFEETIKSRYRDDFTYSSFSEGEKLRINLSIMLAWREISKRRNSMSTNLLVLDEIVDGAADSEAVENLLVLLRNLNPDDNIFVISHRDDLKDRFDAHLKYEKVGGFSVLTDAGIE